MSLAYGAFFVNVVLLPLWLQQYMGYTATDAGIVLAPIGILAIILSPWVGKRVGRIDARRLASVAFGVFALVFWMRSYFNTQADLETILIPTVVQGETGRASGRERVWQLGGIWGGVRYLKKKIKKKIEQLK